MFNEKMVLCGANAYDKKYYLNEQFSNLPEQIKQELQIMCVLFTEEVGGILVLEYDEEGNLQIITEADEGDLLYDDIGCGLKIRQLQMEKRDLFATFRMNTQMVKTSDEYGSTIAELIARKNININEIENVIISSVVPKVMYSLNNGIIKYFGIKPIIVGPGTKTGIRVKRTDPRELGSDRLVDVVAAYELYGGPCIVIDFGTATTYDLVGADGTFEAGVISPGIKICTKALWNETAKLPEIEIKKPESILAKDTISCMQAGIVYGYIGQTEYIIEKMKEESGLTDVKVVATGGLGRIIWQNTDKIDIYDKELTLQGMRIIYEKNKNNK